MRDWMRSCVRDRTPAVKRENRLFSWGILIAMVPFGVLQSARLKKEWSAPVMTHHVFESILEQDGAVTELKMEE